MTGVITGVTLVLAFVVRLLVKARSRRVYAKTLTQHQRAPKILLVAGVLIVLVCLSGLVTILLTLDFEWPVGTIIFNVAMMALGFFLVYYYENSFVEVFPDRLVYRGSGREIRTLAYKDIVTYDVRQNRGQETLRLWDKAGQKHQLNITNYNGSLLIEYVQWLDGLKEYAAERFPAATDQQVHHWIEEHQRERAANDAGTYDAAAVPAGASGGNKIPEADGSSGIQSGSTPGPKRGRGSGNVFGGGDAFGHGGKASQPHGPFYDR